MSPTRILIFSHFSERDGTALLRCIAKSLQDSNIQMQHVILSTYDERRDGRSRIGICLNGNIRIEHELSPSADRNLKSRFSLEVQEHYAEVWRDVDHKATVSRERTIEGALHRAKEIGDQNDGMQTLVTGSLHLVSGALCLLEPDHPIQRLCQSQGEPLHTSSHRPQSKD